MPPLTRRLPCLALALVLGACQMPAFMSFRPQPRGNRVDADELAQLVPGTSTRSDVTAALGTPTARASFNDNQWIYIAEVTRPVIAGTQTVLNQQVYVLTFDQSGVLSTVEHKTAKDAEPVQVVSRTTPSPGSSASFFQQLLGNVGKFSPTGGIGSQGGPGSPTNPGNF